MSQVKTQTSLFCYRSKLESSNFGYSTYRYSGIYEVKDKDADQTAGMHRLICIFAVCIGMNRICHEAAQLSLLSRKLPYLAIKLS